MSSKTGVIVVDLQGDFTQAQNGSLAVAGADQAYVDAVLAASQKYQAQGLMLYATQDWHPNNHCSFATNNPGAELFSVIDIDGRNQVMWPAHCVQNQPGAELLLPRELFKQVVPKGTDYRYDSYSGFADDGGADTGLEDVLRGDGIDSLIIYGLATDYCVRFTVLHAIERGFKAQVRLDLCRGVAPETTDEAMEAMLAAGAELIQ